MRRPDFFIVGAPKCGTSSMYQYLKAHPEIFMSERKEPHFFGKDLAVWSRDLAIGRKPPNLEDYLALFSGVRDEKRVGEASTSYLGSIMAASEIKEFNPASRIIVMLRNPVDYLYAVHGQLIYTGDETIEDFEAALAAEEDRKQGLRIPTNTRHPRLLFYRERARLGEQVDRYLQAFGRNHVHVIIFDEFVKETLSAYRGTLEFLGVDSSHQIEFSVFNPNKRYRSKKLGLLIKRPPTAIRKVAGVLLAQERRRSLTRLLLKPWLQHGRRPPMDLRLRRRLQKELAPEIERLSRLLDRDLSYWSRD